jgi:hypothetical protein
MSALYFLREEIRRDQKALLREAVLDLLKVMVPRG